MEAGKQAISLCKLSFCYRKPKIKSTCTLFIKAGQREKKEEGQIICRNIDGLWPHLSLEKNLST
jgi:hypothetical protein